MPQVTHVNRNRGMQIGGLAGLAAGLLTTISWVAGNGGEGSGAFLVWGPGLSVLGLAIGGTIGAEVDRTRMEWRTVFERRE